MCVAAALLGMGVLAGGCARRDTRVASGTRNQILHLANGGEPKDLDPNVMVAAVEYTIMSALFEGLVIIAGDGNSILPGVAERWEISPDGLTYTFHLRADARWSDGTPVTADDFLFSFRRIFSPELGAPSADWGFAIAGSRAYIAGKNTDPASLGVRAPDPRRLELQLEHPAPYILYVLGGAPFHPLPRHVVERHGAATRPNTAWTRPGQLVGNGAFVLKEWISNSRLVVTRNPHYWDRGRVRLNEVRFYPIDQPGAEERSFRAGELHITYTLPVTKLAEYRAARPTPMHRTPLLWTNYLVFNTTRPPFDNPTLRRALSLAIDRDTLVSHALQDAGSVATSLTRPPTAGYSPRVAPAYDPDEARRLLAKAGFPGGTGLPRIELLVSMVAENRGLAEILQQQWRRELGVSADIIQQESKVRIDSTRTKNYQVSLGGFFYGIQAPEFILMLAVGDAPGNDSGWKNADFDAAFRRANHALTIAERHAAYDEMEELVRTHVPFAPLYFENKCQLVHPDVRGWRDNALYAIDWRDLWLEPAR